MSETPRPERPIDQRLLAEAFADVSAAVNGTLELEEVLDLILDRVATVIPFARGTIMIADDGHLEVVRAKGYLVPIEGLRLSLAEVPNLARVVDSGETSLINDIEAFADWAKTSSTDDLQSNMTAPIKAGGQVVGAIGVDSEHKGAFTPELARRLEGFADQAGNAIRNARLYQESQRALAELQEQRRYAQALTDISAELIRHRDADQILDFILDRISRFATGAVVTLMLVVDGIAEVVRTTGTETLAQRMAVADVPILRRVSQTGRPYLVDDTRSPGSGWTHRAETTWIRSYLVAPISLGGEVVGFMSLSSGRPGAFPSPLIQPLESFSNHVGIALHNARVFAETEAARHEERDQRLLAEAFADVSAAVNGTLELEEVLDLILDRVATVIPFARGTIMIADDGHLEVVRAKGYLVPIEGLRLSLAEVPNLARVVDSGETSLINDIEAFADWAKTSSTDDLQSNMTAPIKAGGQVVGAIGVDSEHKGAFTPELARRLEGFADQAGNAIRNARLYQESQAARSRADSLLRAILPDPIADELQADGRVQPRRYDSVAVLFADVVGFTEYSDRRDPEEVLGALVEIVNAFEAIAERNGLEKIKTIGDSFMAVAGLLTPVMNPDLQCVTAGLEMVRACQGLTSNWTVRVGVHSGELVAGVLGSKKFSFDVWGDTVNTAARLQSIGIPSGVCVSRASWSKISHACAGHSRGGVALKGKGEMEVFVVEGLLS
jgi:GAF domain-containing protein